jgi:hypothetical protein
VSARRGVIRDLVMQKNYRRHHGQSAGNGLHSQCP